MWTWSFRVSTDWAGSLRWEVVGQCLVSSPQLVLGPQLDVPATRQGIRQIVLHPSPDVRSGAARSGRVVKPRQRPQLRHRPAVTRRTAAAAAAPAGRQLRGTANSTKSVRQILQLLQDAGSAHSCRVVHPQQPSMSTPLRCAGRRPGDGPGRDPAIAAVSGPVQAAVPASPGIMTPRGDVTRNILCVMAS
jgi:hypothetical protein